MGARLVRRARHQRPPFVSGQPASGLVAALEQIVMHPGPIWFSYRQVDGARAYEGTPRDARVTRHDQTDRHVPGHSATLGDMRAESARTAGKKSLCVYVRCT